MDISPIEVRPPSQADQVLKPSVSEDGLSSFAQQIADINNSNRSKIKMENANQNNVDNEVQEVYQASKKKTKSQAVRSVKKTPQKIQNLQLVDQKSQKTGFDGSAGNSPLKSGLTESNEQVDNYTNDILKGNDTYEEYRQIENDDADPNQIALQFVQQHGDNMNMRYQPDDFYGMN